MPLQKLHKSHSVAVQHISIKREVRIEITATVNFKASGTKKCEPAFSSLQDDRKSKSQEHQMVPHTTETP